jgi:hypothetical protein
MRNNDGVDRSCAHEAYADASTKAITADTALINTGSGSKQYAMSVVPNHPNIFIIPFE